MTDLERIEHIEETLGITLHRVQLDKLFTEYSFQTNYRNNGVRNYSLDKNRNVVGLALDFCNFFVLEGNYLGNFTKLKKLKLEGSYLNDYSFLTKLENLRELNVARNRLSNYDFLKELKGLTALDLSVNNLSDVSFLKELKGLTSLNLSGTNLSNYDFLKELKGLTVLDLSVNNLSDVSFLKELKGLTALDLRGNNLSDVSFLKELKGLTALYLSVNNLSDVSFLKELKGLTALDLRGNKLSNVSFLKELKGLTTLYLSGNNLSDVSFLEELRSLTYINLDNNSITNPPKEIVEQGLQEIWRYFDDIKEKGIDYIYEAKVLIVGETETGKTTLFKKLLDYGYLPQKGTEDDKKSTVGINIKTWEFPYSIDKEKTIKANLWDFGGQEIQYTLHQYFLTKKSFYIFLISNRVGDNESIHKADYWFKVISLLGKDCPVLVILNERNDNSANNFNIEKYKEQFGKELGEIEKLDVNFSSNDRKWNNLLVAIKEKISNLPHIGKETDEETAKGVKRGLPKQWVEVRRRIEAIKDNHIKLSDYEDICKDVGLYEEPQNNETDKLLAQNRLLRFLHNLGVVINYDDAFLRNYLILSPKWLTESLYMVLEDKTIKDQRNGKFTGRFINDLWKGKSYSETDYYILLNLMLKDNFEIAYKVQGKVDDYVIPMLLPEPALDYEFDETNLITLIIRFTFMPHGVFSRLIVQLNNFIDVQLIEGQNKQVVWKKGMLLRSKENSFAEIIESDDKEQTPKEIKIRVSGENALENKRFLNQIVGHVHQINKDWFRDNLEFEELIPCICDVCKTVEKDEDKQLYELELLLSAFQMREETINCNESMKKRILQKVPIQKLLDGIFFENNREGKNINYYNTFNKETSVAQGDNPTAKQYMGEIEK